MCKNFMIKTFYFKILQDGLWLVTTEPDIITGYSSTILTPNAMEFTRLYKKVVRMKESRVNIYACYAQYSWTKIVLCSI